MTLKQILSLFPDEAAPLLLGSKILTLEGCGGIIVEVEAYMQSNDAAAHSARGKTVSNNSLFFSAGTLYVHTMRHHTLVDVVTVSGSVLLRAIEPTQGLEIMKERRGVEALVDLCNGPGKLCKALDITKEFDGLNVFDLDSPIKIIPPKNPLQNDQIAISKRVGITKNAEALFRFSIKNNYFVSK